MISKASMILTKVMMSMFAAFFGLGVLLGVVKGFVYKSYLVAFIAALLVFAVYCFIRTKCENRSFICDRANPLKLCLIISFLCFAINLVYVIFVRIEPTVDFATFWRTAVLLSKGNGLDGNVFVAAFPHILGYSYFLSFFIKIFGENYLVAAVVNVFLTTFSCAFIYLLCFKFFGVRAACFAGLFWAFCPSKMMYNSMVLSEPYYTCLFLAAIYIIVQMHYYLKGEGKRWHVVALAAALTGLCLALANSARPVAMVVLIALFIWLIFLRGDDLKQNRLWRNWGLFVAVLLSVYALVGNIWNSYAEKTVGQEIPSIPGYNIYVGLNTTYWGSYSDVDMALFEALLYDGQHTVVEAQEEMLELAKERFTSGEIDFGYLFVRKLQTFLGCDEGGAYYSKEFISSLAYSLMAIISNIWYYVLAGLVFLAVFRFLKNPVESVFSLVPLFVLGLTLAQMLVEMAGRYHYSIIPMLVITAAGCVKEYKEF